MPDERTPRVLVVWCPDWPVHAVGAGPDVPAAVLIGQGARRTVLACSAAARAAGVRRGQRVRDAQRMCPQLRVFPRDEAAEERAFEPVVRAVEDVVAGVEVVRPGLIALAARGPARYHGGEARLALLVREAVADAGTGEGGDPLGCGAGIADGAFAATLAARRPVDEPLIVPAGATHEFLAPYPLRVLEHPELAGILDRLGVRTLGALAALPAADVANRFGPDGIRAHRLARGLDPRPPASRHPGEDLSALQVFDPPAERDEPVVFAAGALAGEWRARLAAAGLAGATVRIEITTAGGRTSMRGWRDGDSLGAALSAHALAQRVRWQLDGWRSREAGQASDSDDGAPDPVVALRFVPETLSVDTGSQQALWGREQVPDRIGRVAERIQAMLGHDGVGLLHESGGRDPAARIEIAPWGERPEPRAGAADPGAPWPGAVPAPWPSLVPAEPYPAELFDARDVLLGVSGRTRLTGRPAVLATGGARLRVTGWAGPWPYHERPWHTTGSRRRARLQVATADGRAFLLALEGGAWRVEGVYQ